jgi:hypothetical protein
MLSPASGHLNETLVEEDLAELLAHLHQRMQSTSVLLRTQSGKVIRLEVGSLPLARLEHLRCEIRVLDRHLLCVLVALGNDIADDFCDGNQLALLEVGEELVVRDRVGLLDVCESLAGCVLGRVDQRHEDIAILLDPLELEGVALSNLERVCTNFVLLHLQISDSLNYHQLVVP